MKRRAKMIVLFLLLGAITNVAVAWGCALGWDTEIGSVEMLDRAEWFDASATFGEYTRMPRYESRGQSATVAVELTFDYPMGSWNARQSLSSGWPLLALNGKRTSAEDFSKLQGLDSSKLLYGEIGLLMGKISANSVDWKLVPTRPLWPGFAINTIFYAAILWLPVAGLGALRRRRRVKRGLCPACAYPVGTNPHCTECGRPVSVKTA